MSTEATVSWVYRIHRPVPEIPSDRFGTVPEPERALRELLMNLSDEFRRWDIYQRELCIAPYPGAYGLAGWVITVNGSPPRGTIIVEASYGHAYYLKSDGRFRHLSEHQARAVTEALNIMGLDVHDGAAIGAGLTLPCRLVLNAQD